MVEKLSWPVPKGKQLVSGLKIKLLDRGNNDKMENFEFLDDLYLDQDGNIMVKVKWNNSEGRIKLSKGPAAYA